MQLWLLFTDRPKRKHELLTSESDGTGGRIWSKVVYNKKSPFCEDQLKNHIVMFPQTTQGNNLIKSKMGLRSTIQQERSLNLDLRRVQLGTSSQYPLSPDLAPAFDFGCISSRTDCIGMFSLTPIQKRWKPLISSIWSKNHICDENQLSWKSSSPPTLEAHLRTSSSDVAPRTSNFQPDGFVPIPH